MIPLQHRVRIVMTNQHVPDASRTFNSRRRAASDAIRAP
jgi:hypothetical protein